MRLTPLLFFTALFAGCPPGDGDETKDGEPYTETDADTDADSDADSDADTDSDTDADTDADTDSDLPDARDGMVTNSDACEIIDGHEDVQAGQTWYWGEFHGDAASGWTGQEAWYYFVNANWEAAGGSDCVVVWDTTATSSGTGACSSCDEGLTVEATINLDETTCPAGLYEGYESMTEPYAVRYVGDGTVEWYFPGSGSQFGTGYADATGLNYLADGGCEVRSAE